MPEAPGQRAPEPMYGSRRGRAGRRRRRNASPDTHGGRGPQGRFRVHVTDIPPDADWIRRAAEEGDAGAQNDLGLMHSEGKGVPMDPQEALKWLRRAAEQGLAEAQSNLAIMLGTGAGVPADIQESLKWLRRAAEQGVAVAQFNLAALYHLGDGVEQDDQEAEKWLRLAAAQGHERARQNLKLLLEGEGPPGNRQG